MLPVKTAAPMLTLGTCIDLCSLCHPACSSHPVPCLLQYVMPADPTNPLAVFSKVALDQVLMAPCMTSLFFASMALLEGSRGADVADTVKSKLKPTLLANWTVWPIAHVINFALVPPAQRILYINVINVSGWLQGGWVSWLRRCSW
jgi:hypothetical protein